MPYIGTPATRELDAPAAAYRTLAKDGARWVDRPAIQDDGKRGEDDLGNNVAFMDDCLAKGV